MHLDCQTCRNQTSFTLNFTFTKTQELNTIMTKVNCEYGNYLKDFGRLEALDTPYVGNGIFAPYVYFPKEVVSQGRVFPKRGHLCSPSATMSP